MNRSFSDQMFSDGFLRGKIAQDRINEILKDVLENPIKKYDKIINNVTENSTRLPIDSVKKIDSLLKQEGLISQSLALGKLHSENLLSHQLITEKKIDKTINSFIKSDLKELKHISENILNYNERKIINTPMNISRELSNGAAAEIIDNINKHSHSEIVTQSLLFSRENAEKNITNSLAHKLVNQQAINAQSLADVNSRLVNEIEKPLSHINKFSHYSEVINGASTNSRINFRDQVMKEIVELSRLDRDSQRFS